MVIMIMFIIVPLELLTRQKTRKYNMNKEYVYKSLDKINETCRQESIDNAKKFVDYSYLDMETPNVSIDNNNRVVFDWSFGNNHNVNITFVSGGILYLYNNGRYAKAGVLDFYTSIPNEIIKMINKTYDVKRK